MIAITVYGDSVSFECLHNKIGYHSAVIRMHARTVGIENTRDFYLKLMLSMVVEEKRFGTTFTFIIT